MIPILYNESEVDFYDNGLGALTELYNVDIEEQRNGLFTLKANYPITGHRYKDIEVGKLIYAKPNQNDNPQAFRIVRTQLDLLGHSLEIEADHITYDLTHNMVEFVRLNGNGQAVMRQLQDATMSKHMFTFHSDITTISSSTLEYVNPMEAIAGIQGSFLQLWGGEMKRENRKVSMLTRRGRNNFTSFRLGKNINGLKYTTDTNNLVTRIIPTVKQTKDDKEYFVVGNIVDSKNITKYSSIHYKHVDMAEQVKIEDKDTDKSIKQKIDKEAKNWFTQSANAHVDLPDVTIEIDVTSLQDSADYHEKFSRLEAIELTDTVTVYVPEYGVNVEAIVNELHYDPMAERVTSIVIGTAKTSFTDANRNKLMELENKVTQIRRDANYAATSADGKNKNYYGKSEPTNPVEGDLWFKKVGDDDFIMVWKDGAWSELVSTKTAEVIDKAVDDAVSSSKKYADDLNTKQNEILTGFKTSTNKSLDEAKKERDAISKKSDTQFKTAQDRADKISGDVAEVKKTADTLTARIDDPNTGMKAVLDLSKQGITMATSTDNKVSALTQNVDGLQSRVTKTEKGVTANETKITQTSKQITTEVADRKAGDTNVLTQTKDLLGSEITSVTKGYESAIQQSADGINATVSAVNQIVDSSLVNRLDNVYNGRSWSGAQSTSAWYYTNQTLYKGISSIGINTKNTTGGPYNHIGLEDINVSRMSGRTAYVSVDLLVQSMGGTDTDYFVIYLTQMDADKKRLTNVANLSITGTLGGTGNIGVGKGWTNYRAAPAIDPNTKYLRLTYQMRGNGNVYVSRPYIGSVELPTGGYVAGPVTNNQTTLQLFNDNFALGIKSNTGALISGINGDTGGTRIAGKKIVLDGDVTATGDFYAQGGKFKNLNASNMTTGTLNASTVNLINLNASALTTGIIHGPNLDINLNSGLVTFQKGRLWSINRSIDMNIDQGYLSVANSENNVLIRNGEIAFTQPNLFSPDKDPYLRITNKVISSSFSSATVKAKYGIEFNIKGNEASIADMGVQSLAGIKFGKGNRGKLERTLIGGGDQGVKISGGTITTGMLGASPSIVVGQNGSQNGAGNRVFINAEYLHALAVHNKTKSGSANVIVTNDGALVRATSARKYKTDIKNDVPLTDSEKLLNIPLSTWDDIAELKERGKSRRYFGMIAEEVAEAGLDYLVTRESDGTIEGLEYDRIALLLIPMVKQLSEEIKQLKQEMETA